MANNLKWIENPADVGLTFVAYADEISRHIRHKGWFTNDFQDEKLRGVVYALPGRRGYVAGYADPNNELAARIELSIIEDKADAATVADRIAEIEAEKERDYQAGWQAISKADDEANEAREAVRTEIAVLRASRSVAAHGEVVDDSESTADLCELWITYRETVEKLHDVVRGMAWTGCDLSHV